MMAVAGGAVQAVELTTGKLRELHRNEEVVAYPDATCYTAQQTEVKSRNDIAVQLCSDVETIVRPMGYHVALTGSMLYGGGTGKDIDLIFYRHDNTRLELAHLRAIREALLQRGVLASLPRLSNDSSKIKYKSKTDEKGVTTEYLRFVSIEYASLKYNSIRVDLILV